MPKQLLRGSVLAVLLFSIACCGCSSVSTRQPLSEKSTTADRDKFQGTWVLDKHTCELTFSDDGVGQLAIFERKSGANPVTRAEVIFTKGQNGNYLSLRGEQEGKRQDECFFSEYAFTAQGDLVLWPPHVKAFAAAVEAGKLEGTVKQEQFSTHVALTSPPETVLAFLDDPANSWLFEYKKPLVLRKLDESK